MASDEGFREFQLGGKHLVALFMFTTIVAVVIFLCGVMVGRGVRNSTTNAAAEAAAAPPPAGDISAVPDVQAGARGSAAAAPTTAPPPPVEEAAPEARDNRKTTESVIPPAETKSTTVAAKQPGTDAHGGATKAAPPANAAPLPATVPAAGIGVPGEPAGQGFVVQVAAVADKGQAEAQARRLLDKGYAAYVLPPAAGGGVFRVRIGKFKERRLAEAVVRRLKKEEQLEGWIPPAR